MPEIHGTPETDAMLAEMYDEYLAEALAADFIIDLSNATIPAPAAESI